MRFCLLGPDDERWTAFLSRSDHDVYHLPGYAALLAAERGMSPYACYGQSEEAEFLLPILVQDLPAELGLESGLRDAQSPDGYPGPLAMGEPATVVASLPNLLEALGQERIVTCFIRMHPLLGLSARAFQGAGDVVERGKTIQIVLDRPYDQILGRMRQGHRYEIRKAYEAGYRTEIDRWDLLPRFVSLYRSLMDRVGAAPSYRFSDSYFEKFRDAVGEPAHIVCVLNGEGAPAAAALFTCCSGIIQYHLAAGDPRFDGDAAQKLVIDALVRFGLQSGARVVHLGGGVGARSDSLFRFKAGFSHDKLAYHTIHLTPDAGVFRQAVSAWKTLTGSTKIDSDFFPAYRTPLPPTD